MKEKAFTLIELLAVIVIIGLIMGITIPVANKLFGRTSKEKNSYYENVMVESAKLHIRKNEGTTIKCVSLATLLSKKLIKNPTCSGTSEGYVILNPTYNNSSSPYKNLEYLPYFRCTEGSATYSTTYSSMPTGYEIYRTYNKNSQYANQSCTLD